MSGCYLRKKFDLDGSRGEERWKARGRAHWVVDRGRWDGRVSDFVRPRGCGSVGVHTATTMPAQKPVLCTSLLSLAFVLCLGLASEAAAQPPEQGPDEVACQGKRVGEACSLINGQAGACGQGTCSRLDYSGGSPPKATEESCVVCQAGATPSNDGPPALGTGGPSPDDGGANADTAGAGNEAADGKTEVDEPPKSESRCSVEPAPSRSGGLVALGLLALGLVGMRRRRARLARLGRGS